MKPPSSLFAQIALLSIFWIALLGKVPAQQVTILRGLSDTVTGNPQIDVLNPEAGIVQGFDGFFYGATSASPGTLFQISPQGQFNSYFPVSAQGTPVQGTDHNFYGTTKTIGFNGGGTVFQATTQGQFNLLYTFPSYSYGGTGYLGSPAAGLVQGTDGNFYGTTTGIIYYYFGSNYYGGNTLTQGVVYKITPQGQQTVLHTFGDGSVTSDGADPTAALIQGSDGNFYGTTEFGGSGSNTTSQNQTSASGAGTVFKITPQGQVTILHSFGGKDGSTDGQVPNGALVQGADGNFYGTTTYGGASGEGTIFRVTPQGSLTILHSFADGTVSNDGIKPSSGLLLASDGNFYGTTPYGGEAYGGVIYKMTPQGQYTILHQFNDGTVANDGFLCQGTLVQGSDGNLYGTTASGGPNYSTVGGNSVGGSIFKVTLNLPALTSSTSVNGNLGVPFTYQAAASNATTSITATGLPNGLMINSATGLISGTPTMTATFTATLTMTNVFGTNTAPVTFRIGAFPVPVVTSMLTAFGTANTPFSYTITATNNATSFTASLLPNGLQLDSSTGVISGTPSAAGTTSVSITATNSSGPSVTQVLALTILSSAPTLSQEYVVLHQFNDGTVPSDGQFPSFIFQGFNGTLYGATQAGGTDTEGTIFNFTTQGTSATPILASLGPATSKNSTNDRTDLGLVQSSDGNFYGTAQNGGASSGGFFYKLTPLGQLTVLHQFGDGSVTNDGEAPVPGLIQALDGNFYGMTEFGGSAGEGCIFEVSPVGQVTIIHSFGDGTVPNDGQYPTSGLIQGVDGSFYGTTFAGGSSSANAGTVFKLTLPGNVTTVPGIVTILHSFGDGSVTNDGAQPSAPLLQGDDGNFYGTAQTGGSFESGCVFKITSLGAVTILHSFGDGTVANDGDSPQGALIEGYDGNFYGTTTLGGSLGDGTVFSITKSGTVAIVHSFGGTVSYGGTAANDGTYPTSICQGADGNFYGTTEAGGFGTGFGTVFAILAGQQVVHSPIFTGAAYAASAVNAPFSFTPKAEFGTSGSGAESGNIVQPAQVSMLAQLVHKGFSATNWVLGQGSTPSTMLPNYLSFDATSGTISGTPVVSGTFTVTMTPNNSFGSGAPVTITLYIDVPPLITSLGTAGGSMLTPFSYPIIALAVPTSFGATGLPDWLSVDTTTGVISGTPPNGGTFVFNAVAENYAGASSKPVVLTVTGGSSSTPVITSATSIAGTAGTALTYQIAARNSPTSFSALTLPVGLTCDSTTGTISGTPTTAGTYSTPIYATNSSGTTASEVTFAIAQLGSPGINNSLSVQAYQTVYFSYVIPVTGLVSLYSVTGLPDGLNYDPLAGVIYGVPANVGVSPVSISIANVKGSASGTLNLTVSSRTQVTYDEWQTQYSPPGGANGTPFKDGLPNFLKYFYDINPTQSITASDQAALPSLGIDTTTNPGTEYLDITYRQYALLSTGVTVNLQSSPDLKNWTTVTPDINRSVGYDETTGDPIMEIGVSTNGQTKQFLRLNVTSP